MEGVCHKWAARAGQRHGAFSGHMTHSFSYGLWGGTPNCPHYLSKPWTVRPGVWTNHFPCADLVHARPIPAPCIDRPLHAGRLLHPLQCVSNLGINHGPTTIPADLVLTGGRGHLLCLSACWSETLTTSYAPDGCVCGACGRIVDRTGGR